MQKLINTPNANFTQEFLAHIKASEGQEKTPEEWWAEFTNAHVPEYVRQIQSDERGQKVASWAMIVAVIAIEKILPGDWFPN